MKTEKFSALAMYGKKDVFEKGLKEGFTELAFGSGEWVGDKRIVRLWVFYHPNGKIATYEHPKFETPSCHTAHGNPFEAEYSQKKFQAYIKEKQIKVGEKTSLKELVEEWEQ